MKQDKCAVCGTTKNLENHHIIPKEDGGTDDETNFLTLCAKHHAAMHGLELTRGRKSWGKKPKQSGNYSKSRSRKRSSNGTFCKSDKPLKVQKCVLLSPEEWKWIDENKIFFKTGRGGLISIIIQEYLNGNKNLSTPNILEDVLWNSKIG